MPPPSGTSDYEAALAFLYGRIDYERAERMPYRSRGLRLDRMRELAARLGNPQQQYPIVHVAGTKGKGSTAAMIAAILTASGRRTGLYTSPHLECVEERMAIDGQRCSSQEFVATLARVREVVEALEREAATQGQRTAGPTYFEITTAAALLHFAERQVDAAVLEVGLGGRLDSTNICQPAVSVITTISFDHMRQLGNTLAQIATEKAGIIKPGVPVVSGVLTPEPREVIERTAAERGCRCCRLGRDFHVHYRGSFAGRSSEDRAFADTHVSFDYEEPGGERPVRLPGLSVAMLGRHQAANAAVALAAVGRLQAAGWKIPEAALRHGLARVHCPARTELVQRQPTVILDAAHNVASITALIDVLNENFGGARRRILVLAASKDKDAIGMLRTLLPAFDVVVFTRFLHNPRSTAPEALADVARQIMRETGVPLPDQDTSVSQPAHGDPDLLQPRRFPHQLLERPDPASAWETARALATADDLICVAGSFFLAAELRPVVTALSRPSGHPQPCPHPVGRNEGQTRDQ